MLYNKNQFRKTNDKKVLHKIGKHWVTVSVAFLSLLGLGAVSATATTHADATDNANAQTTSASSTQNNTSAGGIQQQVTKQANVLHNQLLGQAAVSRKPAQQGTARLGSANGREDNDQNQIDQTQNNDHANGQVNANHEMQLGSTNNDPLKTTSQNINEHLITAGNYQGLDYKLWSDSHPKTTLGTVRKTIKDATYNQWLQAGNSDNESDTYESPSDSDFKGTTRTTYKYNPTLTYDQLINALKTYSPGSLKLSRWAKKSSNNREYIITHLPHLTAKIGEPGSIPIHNYRLEFTGGTARNYGDNGTGLTGLLTHFNSDSTDPYIKDNQSIVSLQFDKGVDTSKITSMSDAFSNDASLKSISGLENLNTAKVTSMSGMFDSDSQLTEVSGVSDWDTSKVKFMNSMFTNDVKLQKISDMSNWHVENVQNLMSMFSDTPDIDGSTINQLGNWRFKEYFGSPRTMNPTLYNRYSNAIGNTTGPNPSDTTSVFHNTKLENGGFPYFSKGGITLDKNGNQIQLYKLNIVPFKTSKAVVNGKYQGLTYNYTPSDGVLEFTGGTYKPTATATSDVNQALSSKPQNTFSQLASDTRNHGLSLKNAYKVVFDSDVNLNGTSDFVGMFYNLPNLQSVDMSKAKADQGDAKNLSYMFSTDPSLESVALPSDMNVQNVNNMSFMFGNDKLLGYNQSLLLNGKAINLGNGFKDNSKSTGTNMNGMFYMTPFLNSQSEIKGLSDLDTSKATSMDWMFANTGLDKITLPSSFNTSNVTSMDYMFTGNKNLYGNNEINLGPNFSTANVKSMKGMFMYDPNLSGLTLPSNFNTGNVTNMSSMFAYDYLIRSLNLPDSFDTSKVTDMSNMFASDDDQEGDDNNKSNKTDQVASSTTDAEPNVLDLTLPAKFIINPGTMNTTNMFKHAALHSIDIKNPNVRFNNNTTKIINLYREEDPIGEYGFDNSTNKPYTLGTPFDFTQNRTVNGQVISDFIPNDSIPGAEAFSDVFTDTDGALDWRLAKIPERWNRQTPPTGWTFVASDGTATDNINEAKLTKSGRIAVAPFYKGLMFRNIPSQDGQSNAVEFIDGEADSDLSNFDNLAVSDPNIPATIQRVIHTANTITFDGGFDPEKGKDTTTIISDVTSMNHMFANPNLKHVYFNGSINTSKTTNMQGMFQGAKISDLILPDGFDTNKAKRTANGMNDMFADQNGQASTVLDRLTVESPKTRFTANAKLPMMYETVNGSNANGTYTENVPTDFTKNLSLVGTYVRHQNAATVSDTIDFDLKKGNSTVTLKSLPLTNQAGGSTYTITDTDLPKGYHLASSTKSNENSSKVNLSNINQSVYHRTVVPDQKSATVKFVYAPKNGMPKTIWSDSSDNPDLTSNPFTGNDYSDNGEVGNTSVTLTKDTPSVSNGGPVPDGWTIEDPVTVKFNGGTYQVNVIPKQASQTIYYRDETNGDTYNDKNVYGTDVGSMQVSGNSFAASQAGDNATDITEANASGLPSAYRLDSASNPVEFTGVDDYYIPVSVKRGNETVNYQYDGTTFSASTASYVGIHPASLNVADNVPAGYHLSGVADSVAYDEDTHDVPVTQNTITENVNYAVQNSAAYHTAGSSAFGFSSVINDARTSYGKTSFNITSDNASNLPDGYHLVNTDTKIGPATTNRASSSADNTLEIAPNLEQMTINYLNQSDNSVLSSSVYSGYADNDFSANVMVPSGYTNQGIYNATTGNTKLNALPTSYDPEVSSDYIDVYVKPVQTTSHIQYVDASQNDKAVGNPIAVTGNSSSVKNAKHTGEDITSNNAPQLPNGYVLVNGDNPISYDGRTYNIPVVPALNNLTVTYQYDNVPVATHVFHGGSWGAEVNKNNDAGLPAGYRLVDENNAYGNKFRYSQKAVNVAVTPIHQSDTINYKYNGKTVATGTTAGNDYRATAAGDNTVTIQLGNTPGLSSDYYVPKAMTFNYDGQSYSVPVDVSQDTDTVNYVYNGQVKGSYQFLGNQNSDIDITSANQPDMPQGYHLVNANNQFTANNGEHDVQVTPDTVTFAVNFMSNGKPVGSKDYNGATNTSFTINGGVDAPAGYTINPNQNMNYTFNGNPSDDSATLQVSPIPPAQASKTINFIYTNANHQNLNEGSIKRVGKSGTIGTVTDSDYSALKSGWQVVPNENNYNRYAKFTYNNGSLNYYVEPIQQSEKVWYVNDQTGKLIGNDGPFSDTITVTGNDSRATDAGNNSFVIGTDPIHLPTEYYQVDNPNQVIPFDGIKHAVAVHLIKQAPYSAKASQAAAAASASASVSISKAASSMASETNASMASSYAKSAQQSAASATSSEATQSIASTNDDSEYHHESSVNSQIASSASNSASQSESSANNSLDSSIASETTSSATVPPMPYVPIMPSSTTSSVSSSVASRATEPASKTAPVTLTNKNYPITISHQANKSDVVTYMGRKYPVHYHANGKNTIQVPKRHHYQNVVVSTALPIAHPSSDNEVRAVDHVDFNHVNKHALTIRGLAKDLVNSKPGNVISYHGHKLAIIQDPGHFRFFMITKDSLAHLNILDVGRTDTRNVLRTHHFYTFFIKRIATVHGRHANYVRYEFSYHHHNFWVTGRNDYTPNAYLQKSEFKHHRTHYVRVIRNCRLYRSPKYSNRTVIRNVRRGEIVRVANVINIGHRGYEQTRLVLTNGRYITANKNFVRIIKK